MQCISRTSGCNAYGLRPGSTGVSLRAKISASNQETMLFSIGLLPALLALTDDDSIWFGVRKFKPIIQRGGVPKVEGRSGIRPLEGK